MNQSFPTMEEFLKCSFGEFFVAPNKEHPDQFSFHCSGLYSNVSVCLTFDERLHTFRFNKNVFDSHVGCFLTEGSSQIDGTWRILEQELSHPTRLVLQLTDDHDNNCLQVLSVKAPPSDSFSLQVVVTPDPFIRESSSVDYVYSQ